MAGSVVNIYSYVSELLEGANKVLFGGVGNLEFVGHKISFKHLNI